ncbi:MAG: RagB/SusD family nutrient uptake outer membrane protein [Saprospiraceae bacterium]
MKKTLFYFGLMLVLLLACSEDFTETAAIGALSDQSLQNELGVDLLLTSAYSTLDGENSKGGADWHKAGDNWWMDVIADDAHKGSTDGDQADLFLLETFDWTSGNPYLAGKWKAIFAGINRANAVLDLISKIDGGDFSGQAAEAHFLRGHYNFELQKMFGNVPFISLENFQATEFSQPNSGNIWSQIEADFQAAVSGLPSSQADAGRPTSMAAKAFMAKTMLYQAKYGEALSLLNEIISSGAYSLLPEFVDNFKIVGDNSVESIFSIQFTADGGQSFNGNRGATLNWLGPFGCCGFYQPSQDLVNAYQTEGGLPLLDTYNQTDVANDYGINSDEPFTTHAGPLDPRLDYTVGRRGIEYNGYGVHPGKEWVRSAFADISGPYSAKKHVYQQSEGGNQGTGGWGQQRSGINYHIMRYADVLLMAAEANVEMGNMGAALDLVNQVRSRAKSSATVKDESGADAANYSIELYDSFADQMMARKAVRFERRLEFGMEGHRLFDIRRWGVGSAVMDAYAANESRTITSFAGDSRAYEGKHDMFPIPSEAIDLSQGALTQNPGF